jgi:hypothetical protein
MSIIGKFIDKLRGKKPQAQAPPRIETQWGDVSEPIRLQAARNMRLDSSLRERVLAMVIKECGGDEVKGQREFARRYPEALGRGDA